MVSWSGAAMAQDTDDARAVYDLGVAAHGRGDYVEAAKLFARADALMPNDTALLAAIEAAIQAEDGVLAMTLVDRTATRPPNPRVQRAAADARAKFGQSTGRLVVRCLGPIRCDLLVDGIEAKVDQSVWVRAGNRDVVASFAGERVTKSVEVAAGRETVMEIEAPEKTAPASEPTPPAPAPAPNPEPSYPPPQQPESDSVLASPWFWVGAGLTATLAAASVWSAIDVSNQHDDFTSDGCDRANRAGCSDAADDGKSAQLRTNLLLGATALAGAATVAIIVIPSGGAEDSGQSGYLPMLTARGTF